MKQDYLPIIDALYYVLAGLIALVPLFADLKKSANEKSAYLGDKDYPKWQYNLLSKLPWPTAAGYVFIALMIVWSVVSHKRDIELAKNPEPDIDVSHYQPITVRSIDTLTSEVRFVLKNYGDATGVLSKMEMHRLMKTDSDWKNQYLGELSDVEILPDDSIYFPVKINYFDSLKPHQYFIVTGFYANKRKAGQIAIEQCLRFDKAYNGWGTLARKKLFMDLYNRTPVENYRTQYDSTNKLQNKFNK